MYTPNNPIYVSSGPSLWGIGILLKLCGFLPLSWATVILWPVYVAGACLVIALLFMAVWSLFDQVRKMWKHKEPE